MHSNIDTSLNFVFFKKSSMFVHVLELFHAGFIETTNFNRLARILKLIVKRLPHFKITSGARLL